MSLWYFAFLNVVHICLRGICLIGFVGLTEWGENGSRLLVERGGRSTQYTLIWLVEGEVGARDFIGLMLRGYQRHRRVHPSWWTWHNITTSISNIIRRRRISLNIRRGISLSIRRGISRSIRRRISLSIRRPISLSIRRCISSFRGGNMRITIRRTVGRWKPPRGFADVGHFRGLMDLLEHSHAVSSPYEHWRDVTPFQDVCWYSEWIMADKERMVRHLSERVLRQYNYVQTVPRPPTTIVSLEPTEVVTAFLEFALHVLIQQQRGDPVLEGEEWMHTKGYMTWFYKVSHPLIIGPAPVPEYTIPINVYEEVIVEQQWARDPPDPI